MGYCSHPTICWNSSTETPGGRNSIAVVGVYNTAVTVLVCSTPASSAQWRGYGTVIDPLRSCADTSSTAFHFTSITAIASASRFVCSRRPPVRPVAPAPPDRVSLSRSPGPGATDEWTATELEPEKIPTTN